MVRERWASLLKPPHIRSRVSATCGSTKPTSASFDRRFWASDRFRLINWWQKSASPMGEPNISMFGLLDFSMPAGKISSEFWLNTSHLLMLTWRPNGGPQSQDIHHRRPLTCKSTIIHVPGMEIETSTLVSS